VGCDYHIGQSAKDDPSSDRRGGEGEKPLIGFLGTLRFVKRREGGRVPSRNFVTADKNAQNK